MDTAAATIPQQQEASQYRALERLTGGVMLTYMIAVAAQVATRTASSGGAGSITGYLEVIASNYMLYVASVAAGLASSTLLIVLAAGLYSTFRAHHHYLALAGSFLFLAAAITWLTSAAGGLALAAMAREYVAASGIQSEIAASSAHWVELVRETTGRTGFTLAALGTLSLSSLLAWRGALPRWLGWLGIAIGLLMLFIWLDTASTLHRIGGTGYLLWLLITGSWLVVRGTRPALEGS